MPWSCHQEPRGKGRGLSPSPEQPRHGSGAIDWNQLSYDVMFRVASTQLGLGMSVILDCPLAHRQLYDKGAELAALVGVCGPARAFVALPFQRSGQGKLDTSLCIVWYLMVGKVN